MNVKCKLLQNISAIRLRNYLALIQFREKLRRILVRATGKYYIEDYVRVYPEETVYLSDGTMREKTDADRCNYLNHVKFYKFVSQFVKGKSVADIGCGSGYGCNIIKAGGASSVNGTDLSVHAIGFAKSHFGKAVEFTLQGVTAMKAYRDSSFDVTICSEVLEHLKEYGKEGLALDEIKRVTKNVGLIVIGTPNSELLGDHGFWFEEIDALFRKKFDDFIILENAIEPFGDKKMLWHKRVDEGRTGIVVSQNINMDETVKISIDNHDIKQGIAPGIFEFSGLQVDTSLLHNTHSWIVLAINNK